MPNEELLRVRLEEATKDLEIAQREVERVMQELTVDTPRAHKTLISEGLRLAFEKLTEARRKLEGLSTSR
jgi:hypothetical protein